MTNTPPDAPQYTPQTFQELLELTEEFTSDYDPKKLTWWCKETALAKLSMAEELCLIKSLKQRTKVSAADLKKMLAHAKGKHTSSEEDFGRMLCKATLAKYFHDGKHLARAASRFWIYNDKYWEPRTDEQISYYINSTLLDTPNPDGIGHSNALSQALYLLRAVSAGPEDIFSLTKDPLPIINCNNGELWVQVDGTVQLKPHSADSYQTTCLKVDFDPYATCPLYDVTIGEIFGNSKDHTEMARHWNEFMGYAIQPLRDIASWWLLKGQGENGKTRLTETMTEYLMGETAVVAFPIEQLNPDNRFALSGLVGKRLVLEEDMNKNAHLPDGILKSISERKKMSAEYKGGDRFSFICSALPVMLSNHFPKTSDLSHGMLRRANVIPFSRQFKREEADPTRFPRIWATEMPGVLNRALQGLQRLRTRGRFDPPADCLHAVEVWSTQASPIKAFIADCLEPCEECRLLWTDVYSRFKEWADDENLRFVPGRNSTKREFVTLGIPFKWSTEGHHMIVGYGLRSPGRLGAVENQETQETLI